MKKAEQATAAAENEKRQIEQASSELATKLRAINAQLQKDKEAVDAKRREWQLLAYLAIAGLLTLVAVYAIGRLAKRKKARRLEYQDVELTKNRWSKNWTKLCNWKSKSSKLLNRDQEFAKTFRLLAN